MSTSSSGRRSPKVDTERRSVTLPDGADIGYDRLVLATGAFPRLLGVPGEGLEGVHSFRTLADAEAVRAAADGSGVGARRRRAGSSAWRPPPRSGGAGSR